MRRTVVAVLALAVALGGLVAAGTEPAAAASGLPKGNLLRNGAAEANTGSDGSAVVLPTGWTVPAGSDSPTVLDYAAAAANGYPDPAFAAAHGGGRGFFAGSGLTGTETSRLEQVVRLPRTAASTIDRGRSVLYASASLGGFESQDDSASYFVFAYDRNQALTAAAVLNGGGSSARADDTKLLHRAHAMLIPAGTRSIRAVLEFNRDPLAAVDAANDGYADNIWLSFSGQSLTSGIVITSAPANYNIMVAEIRPANLCAGGRTVKIYSRAGGRLTFRGAQTSDDEGDASVTIAPVTVAGETLIAKVKRADACLGATSPGRVVS